MTSNLGSDLIQEYHQQHDYDQMKQTVMGVLTQHFRPEFINRVDETVVFHPLDDEQIKSIAGIQLKGLKHRLGQKGYELRISDNALSKLSEAGFDPVFGARPLKRAVQRHIENPLAQALLANKLPQGAVVLVDCVDGQFIIKKGR